MYKVRDKKGKSLIKDLDDYTVVDIETTGLDFNFNKILEISALKVRGKCVVDEFSLIINTHEDVSYFIRNLTGITNDMVRNSLELDEVLRKFRDFLGDDIIVGHNVNFDINFLYDNFKEVLNEDLSNDFVDTLRISRRLLPDIPHHRLDDLIEFYGLTPRGKHRALNDCILTNEVYINMCNMVYDRYKSWDEFVSNYKQYKY